MATHRRPSRRARRPGLETLESRKLLAAFVVNSTADTLAPPAGTVTLRSALSNLTPGGPNTITFNLPAGSVIQPASPLPTITAPVTIDATNGGSTPLVGLDGTNAGAGVAGLTASAAGVTIKGLAIGHFSGSGIVLNGDGEAVGDCYIGTDLAGKAAAANGVAGLTITSSNNTVGGPAGANVISGNTADGVAITGTAPVGSGPNTPAANLIASNLIGVDSTGATALPNGVGIGVRFGRGNVLANNVVSSNSGGGIFLGNGSGNVVQGTKVGTDTTGEVKLGNGAFGVEVQSETGTRVGIPGIANLNVISNNVGPGVVVIGAGNTTVANSFIGLDRAGIAAMGNVTDGVSVQNSSTGTTVGGAAGSGNFLAGNVNNGVNVSSSSTGTLIQGNDVGSDVSGLIGVPNAQNGIQLNQAAATIKGNLVLDNGQSGVLLFGGSGSLVQSNFIGDVASGTHGNALDGVFIYGSNNNTIGGAGAGNIISANANYGVTIEAGSQNNVVAGNFVGLSAGGQGTRGNQNGIAVFDSTGTTIGGLSFGAVNIIGGNAAYGVDVHGTDSTGTLIAGNMIGVAADGTTAAANASGIILDAAAGVVVQGNILSGNTVDGIFVNGGSGSTIRTNLIGSDVSGFKQLGNGGDGVDILGAANVTVGGTTPGATNLISANNNYGIQVSGAGATGNTLVGNWIGLDHSGLRALGNGLSGIFIDNVPGTTVGGSASAYNVIDFNSQEGILISGAGAAGTKVIANFVGLAVDGVTAAGNGIDGVFVQGTPNAYIAYNYLSENTAYGVHIASGASGAIIVGDLIGTDVSGTIARGNGFGGVLLDGTSGAVVGGTGGAATRDVISGNGKAGVFIFGPTAKGNLIAGDYIGLNAQGTGALGNGGDGVLIQSPGNVVGGTTAAATNTISGNASAGIHLAGGGTGNVLAGNWIGTDAAGLHPIGNGFYGIFVDGTGTGSAANNLIGGSDAGSRNVIAGSGIANINLAGANATGNVMLGNFIGTDVTGALGLFPTPYGIALNGAPGNTIGGTGPGSGNTISGHVSAGINIVNAGSSGNLVVGNVIGRGASGGFTRANNIGVLINNAPSNTVGGTTPSAANTITGNTINTIQVTGSGATGNQTGGNIIGPDA